MATFNVVPIFDGLHSFTLVATDATLVVEVNAYLHHLATCGRSAYTLKSYARGLADFMDWLQQQHIALAAVNGQIIGDYIGEFARSDKRGACHPDPARVDQVNAKTRKPYPGLQRKNSTINHRLSVLSGFFAFCINQANLSGQGDWLQRDNPVTPLAGQTAAHGMSGRNPPPRRRTGQFRRRKERQLPKSLAPQLAEQLIAQASSWRDKAILTLLLRTGQRIGDWSDFAGRHGILGMTTADVDTTTATITVYLKGARDEHRLPVTDDFWPLYHCYLDQERGQAHDSSALWLAFRRGQGHPLSYATFESALRSLGHTLGMNVNAHMFRHTLAQGILETTGNLKVAQEILGHAHISTTADQYMHVDEVAMLNALTSVKRAFAVAADSTLQATGVADPLQAGQPAGAVRQYVFPYDRITIEELDQASLMAQASNVEGGLP